MTDAWTPATIALTGGTGFVGRALLEVLRHRGHPIRALARSSQEPEPGVEWVAGDLADRGALDALLVGSGGLIHAAGLTRSRDPQAFERANVEGTHALLKAWGRQGGESDRPRLVLVSSLAAREPRLSAYGASKRRAEDAVRTAAPGAAIVRPPAVYGPRDQDMLQLFRAAKWGFVPVPAEGASSLIWVYDLAELLATLVVDRAACAGTVLEPDDGRPDGWSHRALATAIGEAVGRDPRVLPLSARTLRRAARFDTRLRGDKARLTPDRAAYMAHPDWVSSPARSVPGALWVPRMETPEGLRRTASWYRRHGWL